MAKGKPYQSRASEMRGGSGGVTRNSIGHPKRAAGPGGRATKSPMSKNSAKADNRIQSGDYGSRVHGSSAECGNIALGSEGPRKPPRRPELKSESDANFQTRMKRALGPDMVAKGALPRDKW